MSLNRAINRVDHVQRATRCAAVFDVPGFDVERKELRGQSALLHPLDAGAVGSRRRAAQIVIVVSHRPRDVVMRVDHDRAPLNLEGALPEPFIASLGEDWKCDQTY